METVIAGQHGRKGHWASAETLLSEATFTLWAEEGATYWALRGMGGKEALSIGSPLLPSAGRQRNTQEPTDNPASFKYHKQIGKGGGQESTGIWSVETTPLHTQTHISNQCSSQLSLLGICDHAAIW